MTVSELIDILRNQDPEAEVYTLDMDTEEYVTPHIEIDGVDGDVLIRCGDYD